MPKRTPTRSRPANVYVPWTIFPTGTLDALRAGNVYPHLVYMDDPLRYGELLAALWAERDTFVIIEHDILPHSWVVGEFNRCPLAYCAFPYANTDRYGVGLGCVRFRADLTRRLPGLLADALTRPWGYRPPGDYMALANHVRDALAEHGVTPHVHLPPVGHTNPRQQIRVEWERGWCHWPARLEDPAYIP